MSNKSNTIQLFQLSNTLSLIFTRITVVNGLLTVKITSFFQYIIDRYNGSPTNESIINVYSSLLYGQGIVEKGQTDLYDSLNDIFYKTEQRKTLKDYKMFGMFAIKLVRSVGGGVAVMKHFPIDKLAMEKVGEDGQINNVIILLIGKTQINTDQYQCLYLMAK